MSVIPITVFFSLLLAGLFIALFAHAQRRRFGSAERDSLLPLADEKPHVVPGSDHPHADHDHAGGCGCRSGERPPCAGCLNPARRPPTQIGA